MLAGLGYLVIAAYIAWSVGDLGDAVPVAQAGAFFAVATFVGLAAVRIVFRAITSRSNTGRAVFLTQLVSEAALAVIGLWFWDAGPAPYVVLVGVVIIEAVVKALERRESRGAQG
jgi:hypothetical protein